MDQVEIVFDFRNERIVVKGKESGLMKLAEVAKGVAPLLKEIRVITGTEEGGSSNDDRGMQEKHEQAQHPLLSRRKPAIRDFARRLSLENTYQRIAALAYHAIKVDMKSSFSIREMENWFSLCGFKKPTLMRIAMYDAKRKYGYVESKGKDQWTISTGGENIVMEKIEGGS